MDQKYLVGAMGEDVIGQSVAVSAEQCGGHHAARTVGKLTSAASSSWVMVWTSSSTTSPTMRILVIIWSVGLRLGQPGLYQLALAQTLGELPPSVLFVIAGDEFSLIVAGRLVQIDELSLLDQVGS